MSSKLWWRQNNWQDRIQGSPSFLWQYVFMIVVLCLTDVKSQQKNRSIKVFIKKHKESLQGSAALHIRYLIDLSLTSPTSLTIAFLRWILWIYRLRSLLKWFYKIRNSRNLLMNRLHAERSDANCESINLNNIREFFISFPENVCQTDSGVSSTVALFSCTEHRTTVRHND